MVQKVIRNELAENVVGDFYDNSPRRVDGYILNNVDGVKAEGKITLTANPTANDTITIGDEVYKFVASPSNDFEVKIDTTKELTAVNLTNVINTLSKLVDAVNDTNKVNLTCKVVGVLGNGLNLITSNTTDISLTSFDNGANEILPTVGKIFTLKSENNAVQGGNGVFLGVLVNSKEYINFKNLDATLTVANGSQGSICSMGRVAVKVNNNIQIGYVVSFDNQGNIYGYADSSNVPANQTLIENSKFIIKNVNAGEIAILQLN